MFVFASIRNWFLAAFVGALPFLYYLGYRQGADHTEGEQRAERAGEQAQVAQIYKEMSDDFFLSDHSDLRTNHDIADRLRKEGL